MLDKLVMRSTFLIIIVLSSFLAKSQDSSLIKEVVFCGVKVSVPADCQFKGSVSSINNKKTEGGSIKRGNQFVLWTNNDALPIQVRDEAIQQFLELLLSNFEEKYGGYKEKSMEFTSLGQDMRGWAFKVKFDDGNRRFFLATGMVNSEYIQIYCGLTKKPKNNDAIPDFISQIIQLKE